MRQAEYYLRFGIHYGIDLLFPSAGEVCLFIQFLANSLTAPATWKNYKSGAKWWIETRGGDISAFSTLEARAVEKGAANLSTHMPNPAPPIFPPDLKVICDYLDTKPETLPIKAAMLLAFFGFLRASNVLSPTATPWSGPHTLARADVITHPAGLALVLRSTKTRGPNSPPAVLSIPVLPGSNMCPTKAWTDYTALVPGFLTEPAFKDIHGTPLTPALIVKEMRAALHEAGRHYAASVSMHSLRRGGAQSAQAGGAQTLDIADHGTWTSNSGLKAYLPTESSTRVSHALASLFGH